MAYGIFSASRAKSLATSGLDKIISVLWLLLLTQTFMQRSAEFTWKFKVDFIKRTLEKMNGLPGRVPKKVLLLVKLLAYIDGSRAVIV